MAKCDCYYQHGTKPVCYGTKEMEECSCGGDESKCNFYPEKRKQKMANEKRLINLDKAFEAINQEVWWTESEKAYFRSFLVKQPKVDAVEVVHGRWEEPYPLYLVCSECGTGYVKYETYNYCPNCGAKMDGDGNG